MTLDEAWAAAQDALPTGFHLRVSDWGVDLYTWQTDPATRFEAVAEFAPNFGDTSVRAEGPTPADALLALIPALDQLFEDDDD